MPFPKYKPVLSGLIITDSNGNIYLKKYRGYAEYKTQPNLWVKINLNTGKQEFFTLPVNDSLIYAWKGFFFINSETDDDEINIKKVSLNELMKNK